MKKLSIFLLLFAIPVFAANAPRKSPTFTGVPKAPTAAGGVNTTQIATTAFVQQEIVAKAPLASPALTGVPVAPTAAIATNTTQLATTAFVEAAKGVMGPTGTLSASPHFVIGTATLDTNTVTVTLTGAAVFTSASSYRCTANDNTTVEAVKIVQTSGTSITFSNTTGATDVVSYICIGN